MRYLIAYDIADDDRRADVSMFLSGYGPRVQLSVFEVELPDIDAAAAFREHLRDLIDPDDDQVRLYRLTPELLNQRIIYGRRTIEERVDFWIV
ncbi:CRISPR-associated endonuclease Cas2 [Micromonospora musae]|uniref:CRISPR-associated endoribonuclease Cas2 n=1 Tax=Micromonospora musae TaxID=1894970 RepID=A0A3A9Y9I4_9ACTN|nr:CRISPR-associated endonuclease Cas2 [Micromonospora musae]